MDTETKEIAIGSATCLTGLDLTLLLPIVVVDQGAAAAQALVDGTLANQMLIRDGLLAGEPTASLLDMLEASDPDFQRRQFGLIHHRREPGTHTGNLNGPFAGALSGTVGTLRYAIQGNVLTGSAVLEAVEEVVLNGTGGLPERLMLGMEAARAMGGDGRCSCQPMAPTSCGAPPVEFEKSAHIGFMMVSRTGDTVEPCAIGLGCASGDMYLRLNIAGQLDFEEDPVFQLRTAFDAWRKNLLGRPDAVASIATVTPAVLSELPSASGTMTITLKDYLGGGVTVPIVNVTAAHAPDSAVIAVIGPVTPVGDGVYEVPLSGDVRSGIDRFQVVVDDGVRPVTLMPLPQVVWAVPADADEDGDVDAVDFVAWADCHDGPALEVLPLCVGRDFDGDDRVTLRDFANLQRSFTDEPCVELVVEVVDQMVPARCDFPFTLPAPGRAEPQARYQWLFNGTPIPGATGSSFTVGATTNAELGIYHVDVSNSCGTIRSGAFDVQTFSPCE